MWSDYQWATFAGVVYQLIFAFLAVYIALVRDAIQIVRVVGDVLRVLLTASLALEVLSGLLLDLPIRFLGIEGNIAVGGPIQGLFGTRNQLSIVALIAFVTFLVELRTRSVRPPVAAVLDHARRSSASCWRTPPSSRPSRWWSASRRSRCIGCGKVAPPHRRYFQWALAWRSPSPRSSPRTSTAPG